MNPPTAITREAVVLSRRPELRPLVTLFVLALRQHLRGRRLIVLSVLFALPSILAVIVHLVSRVVPTAASLEFALLLNLFPHALVPLAALLCATGIIRDEVEEQTLIYLLLRPLPRWGIYLVKLLATLVVTSVLIVVFTLTTLAIIDLMAGGTATEGMIVRGLKISGIFMLAQVGYCGLFGLLGLLMRNSLVAGVAYIVFFEGLLSSVEFVVRRLTVIYYYRVLVLRWLKPVNGQEWPIDLATAPTARACVLTLLGAGLVLSLVAAIFFTRSELHMKTPER